MVPISRRKFALGAAAIGIVTPSLSRAAEGKKFKVALSNSFIGNKWRIEMVNVYKAALQMEPFASEIEGSEFNSGNDASKQSQQISDIISSGVDALLVDAASPTALNRVLEQAADRGIVVIAFDNLAISPKVLKVSTDMSECGSVWAQYLVKTLNGKGNVIMVTGIAGTQVDDAMNKAAERVWAENPGIKVVGRYTGMWDSSAAERATTTMLPSLAKVDGVWCGGGTDGVVRAFISAGRDPLPVFAGNSENGFRKFMIGYMGKKICGMSVGGPPYTSVVALELARRILNKSHPKTDLTMPLAPVTDETVKIGETVFPDQPDSFFADFTAGGDDAMVKLCLDAALNGTTCGGRLDVRLPQV